jgi:hypothetical protein
MKAVRYGHVDVMKLLLGRGANHCLEDNNYRTPWYYMMFGVNIPPGVHEELVSALLDHGVQLTSSMVLCAATSKIPGITQLVLDSLPRDVLSKTSHGMCDFQFHNLHMLEDTAYVKNSTLVLIYLLAAFSGHHHLCAFFTQCFLDVA